MALKTLLLGEDDDEDDVDDEEGSSGDDDDEGVEGDGTLMIEFFTSQWNLMDMFLHS